MTVYSEHYIQQINSQGSEIGTLKDENKQLKIENDMIKDEITQLKVENSALKAPLDRSSSHHHHSTSYLNQNHKRLVSGQGSHELFTYTILTTHTLITQYSSDDFKPNHCLLEYTILNNTV